MQGVSRKGSGCDRKMNSLRNHSRAVGGKGLLNNGSRIRLKKKVKGGGEMHL